MTHSNNSKSAKTGPSNFLFFSKLRNHILFSKSKYISLLYDLITETFGLKLNDHSKEIIRSYDYVYVKVNDSWMFHQKDR